MVFTMRATVCPAAAERIKTDDVSIVHARDFVKSGSGTRLDPWVGADGAGGIRDAIASAPTGKVRVLCAAGFFEVSSVLKIRADTEVFGAGMNDTTLLHTPFTTYSSFGSLDGLHARKSHGRRQPLGPDGVRPVRRRDCLARARDFCSAGSRKELCLCRILSEPRLGRLGDHGLRLDRQPLLRMGRGDVRIRRPSLPAQLNRHHAE